MNNEELIQSIIETGYLKTPRIIEAFKNIPREDFVREEYKLMAYANQPLPIGSGHTISQPLTIAFMLEQLQPQEGDNILEIGGGSGWQTAMLGHIVGTKGHVYALEIDPEMAKFGKKNLARYDFENVKYLEKDASLGYPEKAPFDGIICGAAFREIPKALLEQLEVGGRIVAPTTRNDIRVVERISEDDWDQTVIPGFVFESVKGKYLSESGGR